MYKITERQIVGMICRGLTPVSDEGWINTLAMSMTSDSAGEEYAWLGNAPAMREWIGGRLAKGMRENSLTIKNKKFEATLEVLVEWLRRDKTGLIMQLVNQMTGKANQHWMSLLSSLIMTGESAVSYDGQYFFDTDHSEGDSGTQSNDISIDISALPCAVHGTTTNPSPEELQQVILQAIAAIMGMKDDQGEPMGEDARKFLVMTSLPLWVPAKNALGMHLKGYGESNQADISEFAIDVAMNARLTYTNKILVFRADGVNQPLIKQEEVPMTVTSIAEGSELEFKEQKHQYGIWASRNVGFGFHQSACMATMT